MQEVKLDTKPNNTALPDLIEALRHVNVFADLPDEQLEWFIRHAEERRIASGEILVRKGEPANMMTVYLEGEMHAQRDDKNLDSYVYVARAGDPATEVTGKLPFSRMTEFPSTSRAVTPVRVLLFHERLFPELLQRMPVLAQRLVGVMSDRVREVTKADQQRDKLIALGKLSAGLAHELNNPAAAARRAADELLQTLEGLRAADLRLCRHNLSAAQRAFIATYEHERIAHDTNAAPSTHALMNSDREDELTTWLDTHEVNDAWQLAPVLAESGVDAAGAERLLEEVGDAAFEDVLARLSAQISVSRLTGEIKASTGRIAELVGAVKEYTYMDQAPIQEVDVRQGLQTTLVILKHKLRKKNINVSLDFAEDLPRITAYGSELNQVWTNLIDNAIDAMPPDGQLNIRTTSEPNSVMVEICDTGAGISPELKTRVFEPFFTTKLIGEGTGLGLDTVGRVVRNHHGNIRFESSPGNTCFQIRLPLTQNPRTQNSPT